MFRLLIVVIIIGNIQATQEYTGCLYSLFSVFSLAISQNLVLMFVLNGFSLEVSLVTVLFSLHFMVSSL